MLTEIVLIIVHTSEVSIEVENHFSFFKKRKQNILI